MGENDYMPSMEGNKGRYYFDNTKVYNSSTVRTSFDFSVPHAIQIQKERMYGGFLGVKLKDKKEEDLKILKSNQLSELETYELTTKEQQATKVPTKNWSNHF